MALVLDGSLGVTFPVVAGSASAVQASSSRVLQVVSATYSTGTTTTSTSYVDTGLTASITPTSSTSKIFVLVTMPAYIYGGGQDSGARFQLVRGATAFLAPANNSIYIYHPTNNIEFLSNFSLTYLDSPATTSATTYKIQMNATDSGTVTVQVSSNTSVMTLMEIAA